MLFLINIHNVTMLEGMVRLDHMIRVDFNRNPEGNWNTSRNSTMGIHMKIMQEPRFQKTKQNHPKFNQNRGNSGYFSGYNNNCGNQNHGGYNIYRGSWGRGSRGGFSSYKFSGNQNYSGPNFSIKGAFSFSDKQQQIKEKVKD